MKLLRAILAVCFTLFITLPPVGAQGFGPGATSAVPALTGSGSETIRRQPDTLRVIVVLQARGSTVKDALASLEQRRQKAMNQLTKLGAREDSIKFGNPKMSTGQTPQQQQMEQIFLQQARSRGKTSIKMPEVAKVTRKLTAEWPLKTGTTEELLIAASEMTKKIRDADLGGANEPDQLTPEEEEIAEEMEEVQNQMGGRQGAGPGQPKFFYVKTISGDERSEAVGKAFKAAQQQAAELAAATGSKLGRLWSVAVQNQDGRANLRAGSYRYDRFGNHVFTEPDFGVGDGQYAAIGTAPGEVTYRVQVQAAFAIEEE